MACKFLAAICVSVFFCNWNSASAASYPQWWLDRNVVTNVVSTNDWAGVNAGQLKWFATKAYDELNDYLPGGAGAALGSIIDGFSASNNYCTVNAGQLKYVAYPIYYRLMQEGYASSYPWTSTTTDDVDFAMVNVGQMKNIFNFDIRNSIVVTNGGTLSIQQAINLASSGQMVLVWPGTYTNAGDKNLDFGGKSVKLIARDGPLYTVINCNGSGRGFVFDSNEDQNAVVDGFTVIGGSADYGGGIYCTTSAPVIKNCWILYNQASSAGGGIYINGRHDNRATALIQNCVISFNSASTGGGIYFHGSSATISNCTINGNSSILGGGMNFGCNLYIISSLYYQVGCAATVIGCSVSSNTAASVGGGFRASDNTDTGSMWDYWERVSPKIYSSKFLANSAGTNGAAGYVSFYANVVLENCALIDNATTGTCAGVANGLAYLSLRNCTISSNQAGTGSRGAGVYASHYSGSGYSGWTTISNSVVWGNVPDANQIYSLSYSGNSNQLCKIFYTCHKNNYPAVPYLPNVAWFGGSVTANGNIINDPVLFMDAYHLMYTNSPCIDAGNSSGAPGTDIDGNSRPNGSGIDMGSHEFYMTDTNTNGILDTWEMYYFGNLNNTAGGDYDNDGLNNLNEYLVATSPINSDTDGDSLPDGIDAYPTTYDTSAPTFTITYPTSSMTIP